MFLKFNVDGSCSGGKGGFGGLFRSPAGDIHSFYAKHLKETTSFQVELLSVQAGLQIILKKSLKKIELETDNEQIARILRQDEKINKVDPILTDVMTKLTFASEHLYDIRINHIYRAANCCANYLANNARVSQDSPSH
ncbi:uncharacterized protein LOC114729647 [Neltuma alba]|uniref:uncharacterized protein LOC114729647 n=1 Tax=Neltuma alba TaxID=207710 RepID=UPI0010A38C2F|nr:uncharacterized protein LOC114729647 [Prosopis alba]